MSDRVVDAVVQWFDHRVGVDGIRGVHPSLFGGEPLMRPRTLLRLMDGLNDLRARHDVDVSYSCSSNGVLLTDGLAAELAARGLVQIQVSLDGPPDIHNMRRIGHHGEGTFEQSLRGVEIACRHIPRVTVKVNFDRQNRAWIAALFDVLVARGLANRVDVKLETIAYQIGGEATRYDPRLAIPPETSELADAYAELWLAAASRGLNVSRDTAHVTPCMFTSEHGVLIGPDGGIYKCISLVGRAEFSVGSVFSVEYSEDVYEAQMDAGRRAIECVAEECAYLPVCMGGCAYESIVRTGACDRRHCAREFLSEFHFKRHLVRHRDRLRAMGMRELREQDFQGVDCAQHPLPGRGTVPDRGSRGMLTLTPVPSASPHR